MKKTIEFKNPVVGAIVLLVILASGWLIMEPLYMIFATIGIAFLYYHSYWGNLKNKPANQNQVPPQQP